MKMFSTLVLVLLLMSLFTFLFYNLRVFFFFDHLTFLFSFTFKYSSIFLFALVENTTHPAPRKIFSEKFCWAFETIALNPRPRPFSINMIDSIRKTRILRWGYLFSRLERKIYNQNKVINDFPCSRAARKKLNQFHAHIKSTFSLYPFNFIRRWSCCEAMKVL